MSIRDNLLNKIDIGSILESIFSTTTKANGTAQAIAKATLDPNSTYLIIAVSNGATGYAYNGNSYPGASWYFSNTSVSFTGGKETLLKEQTITYGSNDGALSYRIYSIETESEEVIATAYANCNNYNGTTAANSGSTMETLFAIKLS